MVLPVRPREKSPGKMQYRQKGFFLSYDRARAAQQRLAAQGKRSRVVHYTDGFGVDVIAPHDFWGRSYIYDRRR